MRTLKKYSLHCATLSTSSHLTRAPKMEEHKTKSKVSELEEEKRNHEQAFFEVTHGCLPWVGTYLFAMPWKVTVGAFLATYQFSHLSQLKLMFEQEIL